MPACLVTKDNTLQYQSDLSTSGKWVNKNVITYALIKGSKDIPDTHEISVAMKLTMQTWQDEIPINFICVSMTQNPDITFEWVPASSDTVLTQNPTALAYTDHLPDGTNNPIYIRLNDTDFWNFTGTNFGYNPLNTMLHESGHALGLVHVPDTGAIMYYMYNGKIMLNPTDISSITALYGKRTWANNAYLRITTAVFNWKKRLN